MKKNILLLIGLAGFILGILGAFVSLKFVAFMIIGIFVVTLFILDFQRVTYVVALFLVLDYFIRQYTTLPKIWGELLFAFCLLLWVYKWFFYRKEKAYRWTPMEFPIFFFVGVGIFLLFINSPSMRIGLEGFRVVMEYIFWFFVATQLIRTPTGAKRLVYMLIFIGFCISLDGIRQYIFHVEIPAGWVDKAEASVGTRVFSIIGSPNILGSLMVLLIPLSLSLVYFEKKIFKKILFGLISLSMVACLLFTFSRGAWIGCIVAILVFAFIADRRMLIPLFVGSLLAALFIPSVRDRVIYLLSDQYVASSTKGGRIGRLLKGLDMLKQNLWFGLGFGRFGGAVAINNKIPDAFYSDNYYLKMVVETGLLGLSAFLLLLYNVIAWSLRTIHQIKISRYSYIAQGAFAGICGVLVHCAFENVFEYTAMTVYFWLLVGVIMYLGYAANQGLLEKKS